MMWRLAFWWRGWRYHRGWRPAVVEQPPEQDFYGSMTLAGEYGWLPAPEVEHSGWWGQTAADLAPEALEPWRGPRLHYATGVCWCGECHDEPGPADSGPDEEESAWAGAAFMTAGLIVADVIANLDSGPGAGPSLAPGPDPEPELGPNAARVLARWEARRRERWRLDWDNETAAA